MGDDREEEWVNPTLAMLAEASGKKRTRALRAELEAILDGRDFETILAAVVPLLVEIHLDAHADEDNTVCATCANADLTELLQAMRRISEDFMGDVMEGDAHE